MDSSHCWLDFMTKSLTCSLIILYYSLDKITNKIVAVKQISESNFLR